MLNEINESLRWNSETNTIEFNLDLQNYFDQAK